MSVPRAVNEHDPVLHQGLGVDQLVVGCIVDDISNACLATFRAPGEVPHIQPQARGLFISVCMLGRGDHLGVGGGDASQLIILLLVVGLSLPPIL